MSEQMGEPAAFGCPAKDTKGVVHLRSLTSNKMLCGARWGKAWIGVPTWWNERCVKCFEVAHP